MITLQLKRTARNMSDPLVTSFIPEVGEPFLVRAEINSSGEFVSNNSHTDGGGNPKTAVLNSKDWDAFGPYVEVGGNRFPQIGRTVFTKFDHGNTLVHPDFVVTANSIYSTTRVPIAYKDGNTYNTDILHSIYNWNDGDTRVLTFNGEYWVIQLPGDYLNNSMLFIGNGNDTVEKLYESGTFVTVSKYVSADMIKNGSITITKLDPDINLASKDALEQISEALEDLSEDTANSVADIENSLLLNKLYYVNCTSAVLNKVVTVGGLPVFSDRTKYDGLTLVIKFSVRNTQNSPTLEVKSSINNQTVVPRCPMYVGNDPVSSAFFWNQNDSVIFSYNAEDNRWYMASTSAMSRIAGWCSENDTTMIDGAMIATGSIAAESIVGGSITAREIAVGSLPATVFNETIQDAVTNLNEFKQQCASAGTIVGECISDAGDAFKSVSMPVDEANSINVTNTGMPLVGTSMVVKFQNANSYQGNVYLQVKAVAGSVSYDRFVAQLGFKIGDAFINIGSLGVQEFSDSQIVALNYYKWDAGDYRTVMFDGNYWIISITTEYLANLAEWCLLNGQTWIGGGTIVTGTIVADQIQSGSIDTAKVSLVCMAPDEHGDMMNYGGVGYYEGSAGQSSTTKGICMFGAVPFDDPDAEPDCRIILTNRGIILDIEHGRIQGWQRKFMIDAENGIFFGHYANDYSNGVLKLFFENLPQSSTGLSSGQVYSDGGVLKIKT